jgi:histidinol-phosphate aminotransferase
MAIQAETVIITHQGRATAGDPALSINRVDLRACGMNAPLPKPWIMDIAPYVPGRSATDDGRQVVKLSSNENPLGTSEKARAAFAAHSVDLERYPDAGATALREALAAQHGLDPARIIYGTGSDEVLHLITGAYAGPGDEVIQVRFGFAVYEIATRRVGATLVVAPDKDYATDVDAILAAVTARTRIVFLANPNNPTGTFTPRSEIGRLHAGLPSHVMLVIDQAYAEYLQTDEDDGGLDLAKTQANVIVTRTFSKIYGLAAERIGWGYGSAEAVDAMHRIRAPFNITIAGQHAAIAAVGDIGFVDHSRAHNAQWRAWLAAEVAKMGNAGLRVVPSKTNFLLILFDGAVTAEVAYTKLMDHGFITRWLPGQGLPNALRVSIGTAEETQGLATALRHIVEDAA